MHPLLDDRRESLGAEEAYRECAVVARREARNFYYSFIPLKRERREALYAIYSFARLADDLADDVERTADERREGLAELEDRLEEALEANPRGAVFIALADTVERFDVPVQTLRDLITGVRQDQRVRRYRTYEELCQYCYYVAGTIGLICVAICGRITEESKRYALAQGLGMQLVNIIRDVKTDAASDRIYIPFELMHEYGVSEADIMEGSMGSGWRAMMEELAGRAREALREGEKLLPLIAEDARICPALLRELYTEILDRIEQAEFDVFSRTPALAFHSKVRLLLSAYWRYRIRS